MASNKTLRTFQRALARYGLFGAAWIFTRLPYRLAVAIAHAFLAIGYVFIIRQKRIARESIRIAFGRTCPGEGSKQAGEKAKEEIEAIIHRCFYSFGWGMFEMLYFMAHLELVPQKVQFEGLEKLEAALQKGNGVVAVTAHFGNFPLMMLALAQRYKTSSIIRPTRDEKLEEYLLKRRTECKLNTVYATPRRQCVEQSLKVLRNNEVLFIPIDQNFGSDGGVFVDFFGHKAATATGPFVFAKRTGAVILPMFIIRESTDSHRIIIEDPIALAQRDNETESMTETMTSITYLIERYIRHFPHEWAWMHRRWKSQPDPALQNNEMDQP